MFIFLWNENVTLVNTIIEKIKYWKVMKFCSFHSKIAHAVAMPMVVNVTVWGEVLAQLEGKSFPMFVDRPRVESAMQSSLYHIMYSNVCTQSANRGNLSVSRKPRTGLACVRVKWRFYATAFHAPIIKLNRTASYIMLQSLCGKQTEKLSTNLGYFKVASGQEKPKRVYPWGKI